MLGNRQTMLLSVKSSLLRKPYWTGQQETELKIRVTRENPVELQGDDGSTLIAVLDDDGNEHWVDKSLVSEVQMDGLR